MDEAPLTDDERAVLDFERTWWLGSCAKDAAIRKRWGTAPTRYYRLLSGLVDRRAAYDYDPLVIKRLRRQRTDRRRQRALAT